MLEALRREAEGSSGRVEERGGSVEAEGRTTNNYLYTGASTDALAEALDPNWRGARRNVRLGIPSARPTLEEGRMF